MEDFSKYLTEATHNAAYAKVGAYGEAGSGKSTTASLIAIGLHKMIGSKKPVGMFDTEPGHQFLIPRFREAGIKFLAFDKSRSLVDLMAWMKAMIENVDIAIIDSITHPWRELQRAYLERLNEGRTKKITRLEFHHWGPIKEEWAKFTDLFLTSKLHLIVCGRAGNIYEYQKNEENGKMELITTGEKMATEKEMGYEPSLLIELWKERTMLRDGGQKIINRCIVEKDRADKINGKVIDFPTFESFKPHFDFLNIGGEQYQVADTSSSGLFTPEGNTEWDAERTRRKALSEEVLGLMTQHVPGQDVKSKTRRFELMQKHFATRSWTAIENMQSILLRNGLDSLRSELEPSTAQPSLSPGPETDPDTGEVVPNIPTSNDTFGM